MISWPPWCGAHRVLRTLESRPCPRPRRQPLRWCLLQPRPCAEFRLAMSAAVAARRQTLHRRGQRRRGCRREAQGRAPAARAAALCAAFTRRPLRLQLLWRSSWTAASPSNSTSCWNSAHGWRRSRRASRWGAASALPPSRRPPLQPEQKAPRPRWPVARRRPRARAFTGALRSRSVRRRWYRPRSRRPCRHGCCAGRSRRCSGEGRTTTGGCGLWSCCSQIGCCRVSRCVANSSGPHGAAPRALQDCMCPCE